MTRLEILNLGRFETGDCALTVVDAEAQAEYDEALDAVGAMKPWTFLRKEVRLREDDLTLGVTQSTCPEEYIYPLPNEYDSVLRVWNDRCKPAKYRIINCELRTPEKDVVVTYTVNPTTTAGLVVPEKVGRLISLYIAMVRSLSVNKSIAMYGKNRSLFKTLIENVGGNDEMQEPSREVFDTQYLVGKFSCGVCSGIPNVAPPFDPIDLINPGVIPDVPAGNGETDIFIVDLAVTGGDGSPVFVIDLVTNIIGSLTGLGLVIDPATGVIRTTLPAPQHGFIAGDVTVTASDTTGSDTETFRVSFDLSGIGG